jgi:hypothetical protein
MNYYLGAEINGSQLKLTALKRSGGQYELVKLDKINFVSESDEAVKQLAKWRELSLPDASSVKVVVTVSEAVLYIKEVQLPKIQSEKMDTAIYWEIPSVSPIPQSEAVYDWQIVAENKDNFNALIIVGKSTYIENIISTFRKAQMEVVAIEPSSYAFARSASAPFNYTTLVCLAQEYGTDFIVLKNGVPHFTTSITGSTQNEKLLRINSGTDLTNEISSEAKKIIKYWESKDPSKIEQILFAGDLVYKYFGYSASLNLFPPKSSYICQVKKFKAVNTGNFKDLDLASHIVSLGAAVRHTQKNVLEGVNIFPSVEKKKSEKIQMQKGLTQKMTLFLYANFALLTLVVANIIGLNVWWYSLENELGRLNTKVVTHSANAYLADITKTNRVVKNVVSLMKEQQDTGNKLRIISDNTPTSLTLSSLGFTFTRDRVWRIDGTGDRESILAYYKKFKENLTKSSISMPYSNFNQLTDNEFSISIIWQD